MKTLYILIGPKGSGKTHIGKRVGRATAITFLQVELLWLSLRPGEDGWKKVEEAIDDRFRTHDQVMIESLGAGEGFLGLYHSLKQKYTVRLIRVLAGPAACLERVRTRSAAEQLAVSDERVIEYNQVAAAVSYPWDLEIDNNLPASDADILAAIRSIDSKD